MRVHGAPCSSAQLEAGVNYTWNCYRRLNSTQGKQFRGCTTIIFLLFKPDSFDTLLFFMTLNLEFWSDETIKSQRWNSVWLLSSEMPRKNRTPSSWWFAYWFSEYRFWVSDFSLFTNCTNYLGDRKFLCAVDKYVPLDSDHGGCLYGVKCCIGELKASCYVVVIREWREFNGVDSYYMPALRGHFLNIHHLSHVLHQQRNDPPLTVRLRTFIHTYWRISEVLSEFMTIAIIRIRISIIVTLTISHSHY